MWWRPSPENRFRRGKYMDWFACLDRDGNGVIDHGDLQSYGRRITEALSIDGDAMSMARLRAATSMLWTSLIGSMDESGEGTIQLDELVGAMITAEGQLRSRGEIPEWAKDYAMCLFRVLDVDGTETISLEEYRAYLAAIGSDADAADAEGHLRDGVRDRLHPGVRRAGLVGFGHHDGHIARHLGLIGLVGAELVGAQHQAKLSTIRTMTVGTGFAPVPASTAIR